jgi:NAD dependent epimerase/dehydratase family
MSRAAKIRAAGHPGMVGSAIVRKFQGDNFNNVVVGAHDELDLIKQAEVNFFFENEGSCQVYMAAAKAEGIHQIIPTQLCDSDTKDIVRMLDLPRTICTKTGLWSLHNRLA